MSRLEQVAHGATITASVVAIFAFGLGYFQFKETQEATRETLSLQGEALDLQRETEAVELFVRYNEVMQASGANRSDEEGFWRGNLGIAISEAIFRLREDDAGWRETARWMLSHHQARLRNLDCATYSAEFIALAREE